MLEKPDNCACYQQSTNGVLTPAHRPGTLAIAGFGVSIWRRCGSTTNGRRARAFARCWPLATSRWRKAARPGVLHDAALYGRQIGRSIGVPTANIRLQRCRSALEGVFAVDRGRPRPKAHRRGQHRRAPDGGGQGAAARSPRAGLRRSIYGALLTVTLHWKIREERRFPRGDAGGNRARHRKDAGVLEDRGVQNRACSAAPR